MLTSAASTLLALNAVILDQATTADSYRHKFSARARPHGLLALSRCVDPALELEYGISMHRPT